MALDLIIILVLALLGIGLIILEVFFIPGFGVAGIGGIAFMAGAVWYSYEQLGSVPGNITLIGCCIALAAGFYWFVKGKMLNRMALHKEIDSTAPNSISPDIKPGDKAVTLSILNPMGTILYNGEKFEAKSQNGFIEVDTPVEVLHVTSTYVIVASSDKEDKEIDPENKESINLK